MAVFLHSREYFESGEGNTHDSYPTHSNFIVDHVIWKAFLMDFHEGSEARDAQVIDAIDPGGWVFELGHEADQVVVLFGWVTRNLQS